jgi:thymidylate synthase (FAD)
MNDIAYSPINVDYIAHMGTDKSVADAARVSFDKDDFESCELKDRDLKLISFLAKHKHTTPFEHLVLSVKIKCPLFVRSQIMRHRTFSYNEVSRRYTSENIEFYKFPTARKQSETNFQCSLDSLVPSTTPALSLMMEHDKNALTLYHKLIEDGVAREQARSVLPQSLMTSFVMTGNALNWARFLKLRLDSHAQKECQIVAQKCLSILESKYPHTVMTFREYGWLHN